MSEVTDVYLKYQVSNQFIAMTSKNILLNSLSGLL